MKNAVSHCNIMQTVNAYMQGDYSPDTMKFPDNSLTICGTPDHFHWYSYHACTTSIKVNDQTVKHSE